ncbi:putative uncharacterized protein ZNRD1-AS1 isoform X2 [Mustela erminea]|uniref:putative uncharacterized protein ZNRD1-AS1 isoform X2 n=1 Tax=Mustela erminea TaxID=36723 RepID=UPI001386C81D|nr:putative uncharacterized protein ZNRD1-AS1 isoform X2 [Mustela erminea]
MDTGTPGWLRWLDDLPLSLAWAKTSTDPRIAVGQQSPLEKKILNLGGVHTAAARQLITRKYHEEYETLCREQALSLDHWLAKAESYYNKRIMDMMKEQGTGHEAKTRLEGKTTHRLERPKQYYLVPEREVKHIERHIQRVGRVRESKNKPGKQLPGPPSETTFPKIVPEEHGVLSAQRRRQVSKREQTQIEGHQERMLRGRALTEQRRKEGVLRKTQSQLPTREQRGRAGREMKELESVTAYPLFQPRGRSRIKVNILMEKNREEVPAVIKPHQRKFLTMPPFLRSQIGKMKD